MQAYAKELRAHVFRIIVTKFAHHRHSRRAAVYDDPFERAVAARATMVDFVHRTLSATGFGGGTSSG